MPVAYIPRTRELYNAYTPYRWVMNEEPPPWTPLKKPLAECKVAMMSSGGVLYRDQPRFHREDTSYRLIPKNARRDELTVWHFGYPTKDAEKDPNAFSRSSGCASSRPRAVSGSYAIRRSLSWVGFTRRARCARNWRRKSSKNFAAARWRRFTWCPLDPCAISPLD